MQLISLGGPAVKIISKSNLAPEGELVIIYNPYSQVKGLPKLRKQSAPLVLASRSGDKAYYDKQSHEASALVIDSAGEYEIKNVLITAQEVVTEKDTTVIFRLDLENIAIGLLAGLKQPLANGLLEYLEGIDILLLPVGGGDGLNVRDAIHTINQLEPRLIIPVQYKSKRFGALDYDPITAFIKEYGQKEFEVTSKLKVQKKDLPNIERKLVLLE